MSRLLRHETQPSKPTLSDEAPRRRSQEGLAGEFQKTRADAAAGREEDKGLVRTLDAPAVNGSVAPGTPRLKNGPASCEVFAGLGTSFQDIERRAAHEQV